MRGKRIQLTTSKQALNSQPPPAFGRAISSDEIKLTGFMQ